MLGSSVVTGVVLLLGVFVNTLIIWIYSRKNSRLNKSGQREFPLVFAAIDLIALTVCLPLQTLFMLKIFKESSHAALAFIFNLFFLFIMNGYLLALITATVDKFYAVYHPFSYRLMHKKIVKTSAIFAFVFSVVMDLFMICLLIFLPTIKSIIARFVAVMFLPIIITVIILTTIHTLTLPQFRLHVGREW